MTDLRVDLYGVHIGTLSGERDRFDFLAHREGLERFGLGSNVMSVAVPLLRRQRGDDIGQRRAFFEEVLAEGGVRRTLADNARLDTDATAPVPVRSVAWKALAPFWIVGVERFAVLSATKPVGGV